MNVHHFYFGNIYSRESGQQVIAASERDYELERLAIQHGQLGSFEGRAGRIFGQWQTPFRGHALLLATKGRVLLVSPIKQPNGDPRSSFIYHFVWLTPQDLITLGGVWKQLYKYGQTDALDPFYKCRPTIVIDPIAIERPSPVDLEKQYDLLEQYFLPRLDDLEVLLNIIFIGKARVNLYKAGSPERVEQIVAAIAAALPPPLRALASFGSELMKWHEIPRFQADIDDEQADSTQFTIFDCAQMSFVGSRPRLQSSALVAVIMRSLRQGGIEALKQQHVFLQPIIEEQMGTEAPDLEKIAQELPVYIYAGERVEAANSPDEIVKALQSWISPPGLPVSLFATALFKLVGLQERAKQFVSSDNARALYARMGPTLAGDTTVIKIIQSLLQNTPAAQLPIAGDLLAQWIIEERAETNSPNLYARWINPIIEYIKSSRVLSRPIIHVTLYDAIKTSKHPWAARILGVATGSQSSDLQLSPSDILRAVSGPPLPETEFLAWVAQLEPVLRVNLLNEAVRNRKLFRNTAALATACLRLLTLPPNGFSDEAVRFMLTAIIEQPSTAQISNLLIANVLGHIERMFYDLDPDQAIIRAWRQWQEVIRQSPTLESIYSQQLYQMMATWDQDLLRRTSAMKELRLEGQIAYRLYIPKALFPRDLHAFTAEISATRAFLERMSAFKFTPERIVLIQQYLEQAPGWRFSQQEYLALLDDLMVIFQLVEDLGSKPYIEVERNKPLDLRKSEQIIDDLILQKKEPRSPQGMWLAIAGIFRNLGSRR